MNIKIGNILDAPEDIICHQVNCQGVMGAGLALQLRKKYPSLFDEYKVFAKHAILADVQYCEQDDGKIIANMFSQFGYGFGLQTNYFAMTHAFLKIRNYAENRNLSIAIPYGIGCGLAGGDWKIVSEIIESVFGNDATIYKWNGK